MISTSTKTVTVNAAYFEEVKEANHELKESLHQVRLLIRQPLNVRNGFRCFVQLLDRLRDHLAMHFALEEAFGYFDDPVFVMPELSQLAETLRAEHGHLYIEICRISHDAECRLYGHVRLEYVKRLLLRLNAFCDQLAGHEARENELIFSAYMDDVGVGD